MRFVERNLWPCLALVLVACSLVTEFPEPREEVTSRDGGVDGGDGSGDRCDGNDDCDSDELCCNSRCVATSKDQCTACTAGGCSEEAPNCSNRTCECEQGTGRACTDSQVCDPESDQCVGCRSDADCTALGGDLTQCVDSKCVECDRKSPATPSDDEGCTKAALSVCNAQNVCEGCSSDDQCGPNQQCIPSRGCFGCSVTETDLTKNGCTNNPSTPICRSVGENSFQCSACTTNEECRGGFCNEAPGAGTCHAACDPNVVPPQVANGCETTAGRPSCKADAMGVYSCQRCTLNADCAFNPGTTCATTGPQAGTCVRGPTGPADCVAPTPAFLPPDRCVECTTDAQCANSTVGKYCNPADYKCAPCTAIGTPATRDGSCLARSPTTPFCNASGLCGNCKANADCAMTPATPICSAGTCSACTAPLAGTTPDEACEAIDDDLRCVTAAVPGAPVAGSCAVCNPDVADTSNGCSTLRPVCLPAPTPGGPLACQQCRPGPGGGCQRPGEACEVRDGRYECVLGGLPGAVGGIVGGVLGGILGNN